MVDDGGGCWGRAGRWEREARKNKRSIEELVYILWKVSFDMLEDRTKARASITIQFSHNQPGSSPAKCWSNE